MNSEGNPKRLPSDTIKQSLDKAPENPDNKSEAENNDWNSQTEFERQIIKTLKQDRKERKKYASAIFRVIYIWLCVLLFIALLDGTTYWTRFLLPEKVMLALIGGTTVDVIGLFYVVTRYLFRESHGEQSLSKLPKLVREADSAKALKKTNSRSRTQGEI